MSRTITLFCTLTFLFIYSISNAQEPSVLIEQAEVIEQPVTETLTVYGQVEADPASVQVISLLHDAIVTRVAVGPGRRVSRGDLLLELSISPESHMDYLKARGAVEYAQKELTRQEGLLKEQLATNAQIEAARNALYDAKANLQSLEAQGKKDAKNKISSPLSGILTWIGAKQGATLQAGTPVAEIATGSRLVARLGVEPEDIFLLKPEMPVKIRSVFADDDAFDCGIREIHAVINPDTHLVDVLVPVPADKSNRLVIGSSLSADIRIAARTGLTVPRSAVLQDDKGSYVFQAIGGRARRLQVATGWEEGGRIEITNGLKKGDSVISLGNYELNDGMPVREGK